MGVPSAARFPSIVSISTVVFEPATTIARPLKFEAAFSTLPAGDPRRVSPSFTTYSDETVVTPGFKVITRASANPRANARLAIMEFPKAAVIGVIGDADAVPHDY